MRKQREFRRHLLAAACFCGSVLFLTSAHSGGLGGAGGLGLGTGIGGLGSTAGAAVDAGLAGSIGQTGAGIGGTVGASAGVQADFSGIRKATDAAHNVVTSISERKSAAENRLHATAVDAKAVAMNRATIARDALTTDGSASFDVQASGQAKASKQDGSAGANESTAMPPRK